MQKEYDIVIIGAGVVGSMLAYKLASYRLSVALVEKAADVAEGISKANSGVLHAGFNVPTGSLKAKLNLKGLRQYPSILKRLGIPFERCKKVVVAFDHSQKEKLIQLMNQGRANGCRGLKIITQKDIQRLNPDLGGKWALYSPKTAIIAPYQLTTTLAENATKRDVAVLLKSEVTAISSDLKITINSEHQIKANMIINCAGIFADKVASLFEKHPYKVYPCRGEYYILDKKAGEKLNIAVYPVPLDDGRSLGVHLTPTLNGNILLGPSAEYQDSKIDLGNSKDVMDQLKNEAYKLLPSLKGFSFIKNYSGLRPKLSLNSFSDFIINPSKQNSKMVNLLGIESPGLTAAPAIADYVITEMIAPHFKLRKKIFSNSSSKAIVSTSHLTLKNRNRLIKKNTDYGEIVCRCEQVSLAEIEKSLNNNLGAQTLNAIKKRTRATMGRCQGGHCHSKIIELMRKRMPTKEICKSNKASSLFPGERS